MPKPKAHKFINYVNEIAMQEQTTDSVKITSTDVNEEIIIALETNTHPFHNNIFFSHNPVKLAAIEFYRCYKYYLRRVAGQGMFAVLPLMKEIEYLEAPIKVELVNLAEKVVREMYNIPVNIDFNSKIERPFLDFEEEALSEQSLLSLETNPRLSNAIEKRRILNSIVHGAGVYQWTSLHYLAQEELGKLNPALLNHYNDYTALVNYWNWAVNFQSGFGAGLKPMVQGVGKVDLRNKAINVSAINFPVLVHELSKTALDFVASAGIPSDFTKTELQILYQEADKYAHEGWHYFFGPTLWSSLLESAHVDSAKLPLVISNLAKMDYEKLAKYCIDIVCLG